MQHLQIQSLLENLFISCNARMLLLIMKHIENLLFGWFIFCYCKMHCQIYIIEVDFLGLKCWSLFYSCMIHNQVCLNKMDFFELKCKSLFCNCMIHSQVSLRERNFRGMSPRPLPASFSDELSHALKWDFRFWFLYSSWLIWLVILKFSTMRVSFNDFWYPMDSCWLSMSILWVMTSMSIWSGICPRCLFKISSKILGCISLEIKMYLLFLFKKSLLKS